MVLVVAQLIGGTRTQVESGPTVGGTGGGAGERSNAAAAVATLPRPRSACSHPRVPTAALSAAQVASLHAAVAEAVGRPPESFKLVNAAGHVLVPADTSVNGAVADGGECPLQHAPHRTALRRLCSWGSRLRAACPQTCSWSCRSGARPSAT